VLNIERDRPGYQPTSLAAGASTSNRQSVAIEHHDHINPSIRSYLRRLRLRFLPDAESPRTTKGPLRTAPRLRAAYIPVMVVRHYLATPRRWQAALAGPGVCAKPAAAS